MSERAEASVERPAKKRKKKRTQQPSRPVPAFAQRFPRHPALDALVDAFERGDYARCGASASSGEAVPSAGDDDTVRAGCGWLRRVSPPDRSGPACRLPLGSPCCSRFLSAWRGSRHATSSSEGDVLRRFGLLPLVLVASMDQLQSFLVDASAAPGRASSSMRALLPTSTGTSISTPSARTKAKKGVIIARGACGSCARRAVDPGTSSLRVEGGVMFRTIPEYLSSKRPSSPARPGATRQGEGCGGRGGGDVPAGSFSVHQVDEGVGRPSVLRRPSART